MKVWKMILTLMIGLALMACNGDGNKPADNETKLANEQQAEIVAAVLASDKGGVKDDISGVAKETSSNQERQSQLRRADIGFDVSVEVDFYDTQDFHQNAYDPETTDRFEISRRSQGEITNDEGFFREFKIDNSSDLSVDGVLSRVVVISGNYINHSSYKHTEILSGADVDYQLDCQLTLSDLKLDLDAEDTFPESGTIEGSVKGYKERKVDDKADKFKFKFKFSATFSGENTVEVKLGDGIVYVVQLDSGTVEAK